MNHKIFDNANISSTTKLEVKENNITSHKKSKLSSFIVELVVTYLDLLHVLRGDFANYANISKWYKFNYASR